MSAADAAAVSAPQGQSKRLPAAFIPLALTYLAVAVNATIANIALPSISTSLNADNADLAWIVNATPLASAAVILFAGGLGDRAGRKKILMFGIALFMVSALLSIFVDSPNQLIALRALSGIGSAFAMPAALAMVFDVVARPARPTAVGIMSATQALGSLLGPLLGGIVLLAFWWGAAFLVVLPFLAIAMAMGVWLLPKDVKHEDADKQPLDLPAAGLTALAGIGLMFAVIEGSSPNGSPTIWVSALVIGILSAGALIWWESRCENPMIDLKIVSKRQFSMPTGGIFLVNFVLGGVMFVTTQYTQLVLGYSPFMAGVFLLPALIVWGVTATLSGRLAKKFGNRQVIATGFVLSAAGLVIIATSGVQPMIPLLLLGLGLVGFMGVGPAQLTHMSISSFPAERRTVGSALNSLTLRFGLAFGVAGFASVLGIMYESHIGDAVAGLTSSEAASASNSLGGAVRVANGLTGSASTALLDAARAAYVSGFSLALICAAVLLVIAAALMALLLPRTVEDDLTEDEHLKEIATQEEL